MCRGGGALALSKDHKVRTGLMYFSFYSFNFPKKKNATGRNGFRPEIETWKGHRT
jgi:hypothetical protein